jgi:hypothetical protein
LLIDEPAFMAWLEERGDTPLDAPIGEGSPHETTARI